MGGIMSEVAVPVHAQLAKSPTGIPGLDEITDGGLPRGRPTLICGNAGCGKTLLAMECLLRGATEYGEPGVFVAFEETARELAENVRSLGFDLDQLVAQRKLIVDHVHLEPSEMAETGEYDLEGLFIRLGHAIDSIGARRVALDTIELLFAGLANQLLIRAELRRLFRWLKDKGVTAIITGERGDGALTRQGLEEYVSDCVIALDHRVSEQISTRRLRVVKYRGSAHGTNEYPFLIDESGISVLPVTSLGLQHSAPTERISSGIPRLDTMLGGQGYYRGSSILVSGTAGTGKTSLAAHFIDSACRQGQRAIFFAFEESQAQLVRNMQSIGIDLKPWLAAGCLRFHASRPTLHGLEMHLATLHRLIDQFQPQVVVVDPVSNFISAGTTTELHVMLVRLIDFLKSRGITALLTALTSDGPREQTESGVSSIMDTWLLLRDIELGGERNRCLYILKSRGMAHSNQLREFLLTPRGVELLDVYVGPEGVLTGSARLAQGARAEAVRVVQQQELEAKQRELERLRQALDAQIALLQAEFQAKEDELTRSISQHVSRGEQMAHDRVAMARSRGADPGQPSASPATALPLGAEGRS